MADKNLLQLPLAITSSGALLYGIQDNTDKAFPASVLQGSEQPQGANLVYAGPPTAPGNYPTFRPLVQADIPDLSNLYLASNGGTLVGATINNSNIVGGNISGATAVFDDNKFSVRNVTDTTKVIRFSAANITAGQTRIFGWPDANGTVVTDNASQDLTNKAVFLRASGTSSATFRIPHGQAPASPVNGDMWTTNAGLYVQANNATIGPLAAAASSTVTTFNGRQGAVTLSSLDVTNALGFTPYNPALNSYVQKSGDTMTGALVIGTGGGGQLRLNDNTGPHYMRAGSGLRATNDGIAWLMSSSSGFEFVGPTTTKMFEVNAGYARHYSRTETGPNKIAMVADAAANRTGFLEFRFENGTRAGYIGYSLSGSVINCDIDTGATGWSFTGTVATSSTLTSAGTFTSNSGGVNSKGASAAFNVYDRTFGDRYWSLYSDGTSLRFWLNGVGENYVFGPTGNFGITGAMTAGGGWGPGSDPRLKQTDSLRPVDNALQKVYNLNVKYGKYHDWYNADRKERIFLMADKDLEDNVPQVVMHDLIEKNDEKYNGWSADQMIALLVKAVQELTDKVNELEERQNG